MLDKLRSPSDTRWDPVSELAHLQRAMNRLFETPNGSGNSQPAMNVYASGDEAIVTAELPGVDPTDLDISVNSDILTISGSREAEAAGEGHTWHRRERGWGRFTRSIELPFRIEADKVQANLKNGVLKVVLPRAEMDKPKKIAIEAK